MSDELDAARSEVRRLNDELRQAQHRLNALKEAESPFPPGTVCEVLIGRNSKRVWRDGKVVALGKYGSGWDVVLRKKDGEWGAQVRWVSPSEIRAVGDGS